jgi:hypothetical protein
VAPAGLPSVFRRSIFFFSSSKVPQLDHKIPTNIACAISYQLLRNLSSTMDGYSRQQGNNKNEKVVNSKANLAIVPLVK